MLQARWANAQTALSIEWSSFSAKYGPFSRVPASVKGTQIPLKHLLYMSSVAAKVEPAYTPDHGALAYLHPWLSMVNSGAVLETQRASSVRTGHSEKPKGLEQPDVSAETERPDASARTDQPKRPAGIDSDDDGSNTPPPKRHTASRKIAATKTLGGPLTSAPSIIRDSQDLGSSPHSPVIKSGLRPLPCPAPPLMPSPSPWQAEFKTGASAMADALGQLMVQSATAAAGPPIAPLVASIDAQVAQLPEQFARSQSAIAKLNTKANRADAQIKEVKETLDNFAKRQEEMLVSLRDLYQCVRDVERQNGRTHDLLDRLLDRRTEHYKDDEDGDYRRAQVDREGLVGAPRFTRDVRDKQ
ncbi:hypothetical protein PFICI_12917 [Pestalotiopsis fici W106-1]|uniref:Uncharacterized protein n=1 Tax=Pestalotiopsis fici (strain W106-1 / CGMCC3.15140) TaxID=1229662 RepID=W3WQ31_PESFW|nr:uncharacterized protein PFICI_12917 [Pestalotiopsis fici W106-1]ETS75973.1 hypothetical protein PFICI_12917 [Pestalotiopsis fici W106-1]